MIKLEHYLYMIEISSSGSINKAAENLYVSQPYLSMVLKELEEELNVKLFTRTNRGVILTDEGNKFLEYAKEIDNILKKTKSISSMKISNRKLHISCMYSYTMLDLYHSFSLDKENHDITYEEIPNHTIPKKIIQGKSDLGIIYTTSDNLNSFVSELNGKGVVFTPLCEENLHIIVNSNHPLSNRESVTVHDLYAYSILIEKSKLKTSDNIILSNPLPHFFKNHSKKPLFFDNNRSLMYYLTKSVDCFSVGLKYLNLSNPFVNTGTLKYIPITDLNITMITGYITNENLPLSDIQLSFINYLDVFFSNI